MKNIYKESSWKNNSVFALSKSFSSGVFHRGGLSELFCFSFLGEIYLSGLLHLFLGI